MNTAGTIKFVVCGLFVLMGGSASAERTVEAALEQAHGVLAEKFVAADGLLLDYIGELSTL